MTSGKANRHNTGQLGEALVAAEFARRGFTFALPTGNAPHVDILAFRPGQQVAVQVKTVSRGGLQLILGKFLNIEMREVERRGQDSPEQEKPGISQIIHGRKEGLDEAIFVIVVFTGDRLGKDRFYCTDLGRFADFLKDGHQAYLDKNGGRRPGKNPKSLHAAFKEPDIEEHAAFCDIDTFFDTLTSPDGWPPPTLKPPAPAPTL